MIETKLFFQRFGNNLLSGDLSWVAAQCNIPVAAYFDAELLVAKTQNELMSLLQKRRNKFAAEGITKMCIRNIEERIHPDNRISVTIDWDFFDHMGQPIGESTTRFFCAPTDQGLRLLIMERPARDE